MSQGGVGGRKQATAMKLILPRKGTQGRLLKDNMKAISAHVTGFYRSSFHAYTTEVSVDGHRWRLGLRYSKFHEFYDRLALLESDFHAPFPPKGTLFFTPKPEERQEQLEEFLQQVLVHFVAKGCPTEMEDLLCELLKVPRHLKSSEHEDDDVSTSTESVLDEPMLEPPTDSAAVEKEVEPKQQEEKVQATVTETEVTKTEMVEQASVQEAVPESPIVEEKIITAPEPAQPASPVAEEAHTVEEKETPITHEEAEVETPLPVEEVEVAKEGMATVDKEDTEDEEEKEPLPSAEQPASETIVEEAAKEGAAVETRPEASEVPSFVKQPVVQPIAQTQKPASQVADLSAASENTSPKEQVDEQKEIATSGRVSSWLAAYLPKSLLGFIRRRCLKKTNLVVLCVALLLPMVLARR